MRTNLTMRQLAPLFGVSPATVCRGVQQRDPLLAVEPARAPQQTADRLWIVDADTYLLIAAARGGAKAWRESGLPSAAGA